jgi:hypothetical protein
MQYERTGMGPNGAVYPNQECGVGVTESGAVFPFWDLAVKGMELREAIAQANQELDAARLDPGPALTAEIFLALDAEPTVEALARSLYLTHAEVLTRRPQMVDVIARQYLAVGIWIGRRTKELMEDRQMKLKKGNGQPE